MADHLLDIYNENFELIGKELKSVAHEQGHWHQVFSCIIINSKKNKIFFQKKVPGRYVFERPDYIDITVGGHLKAGEDVLDGIREIEEETGFKVDNECLISLGMRQNTFSAENRYYAYEYQNVFLYDTEYELSDFKGDDKEVSGFVEVDIDEMLDLLLEKRSSIQGKHAYMMHGEFVEKEYSLSMKDIIPSYLKTDKFMIRIVIAARRYCNGEKKELLFW